MVTKTYIGDMPRIRITLSTDLTLINSVQMLIKRADNIIMTKSCVVETPLTGIVYYDCLATDLNIKGSYYIQLKVVFNTGKVFFSSTQLLYVYDLYE
jgi:hypothetical protein